MPYLQHPSVSNERSLISAGRNILIADTSVVLDCCDPRFSRFARNQLEAEQLFVMRRYSFDEVRLVQN